MSEIRDYLEAQAAEGGNKWLQDGYRTHPAILEAVREFRAGGGFNNEEAEKYIEAIASDLPEHYRHGHEKRHPLTYQLGHEVYIANGMLSDERDSERIVELEAEGFEPVSDFEPLVDGQRYMVVLGKMYNTVPRYGTPHEGKIIRHGSGYALIPKGKRTNGYLATKPAMYRAVR